MGSPINPRSVRFRTTAGAALALSVLLVIAGVAINWLVSRQIQRSFDATLLEQATDRATLLSAGAAPESLMTVVGHEVIVVALSAEGRVLASAGTPSPGELVGLVPGVGDVSVLVAEAGDSGDRESLRVAVATASDGSVVIVGNEGESARDTQAQVRNMLLAAIPLVAVAGACVAWFVTGRALRPVQRMQADLDGVVHAGDGRRVGRPGSGDEIDELAETINEVLERLDAQSAARRRFVADASHELKSPLANARILIDTASTDADVAEAESLHKAVARELNRLQALVDDLLYLARVDETTPTQATVIDLDDLVFDEAERVAARSSKTIDASGVQPARAVVDPAEAARAIRNLVENAERFASGSVTLAISRAPTMVTVEVGDDGPGIPVAERDRVFERFSRLGDDRARADGGTGLGLAIVASIAARNNGDVVVRSSPSGGALFELSFPEPR